MASVQRLKDLITQHNVNLTQKLIVDHTLLSYFQQRKVLTTENVESIMAFPPKSAKAAQLLMLLTMRGDRALDPFYAALVGTFQFDLADLIKPELAPSRLHSQQMQQPVENGDHQMVSSQSGSSLITQVQGPPAANGTVITSVELSGQYKQRPADLGDHPHLPTAHREIPDDSSVNGGEGYPVRVAGWRDIPDRKPATQENISGGDSELSDDESDLPDIPIFVKPTTEPGILMLREKRDKVYEMSFPIRGHALIINNEFFDMNTSPDQAELKARTGSAKDCDNLNALFRSMGLHPDVRLDVKSTDLQQVISDEIKRLEHHKYGLFVLVLMSHGNENVIYGADSRPVKLDALTEQLTGNQFPRMRGKPKIVFVQACAGEKVDIVTTEFDCNQRTMITAPSDSSARIDVLPVSHKLVTDTQDIAVVTASFKGHVSVRETDKGTWFIRSLVHVLMKHACHLEFNQLMNKVRRRVMKKCNKYNENKPKTKQVGQTVTCNCVTLMKDLYFFPGASS